jgi:hypothetical protein
MPFLSKTYLRFAKYFSYFSLNHFYMKPKLNLIAFFLCCGTLAFSQQWISPNAEWHYDYSAVASGGFVTINYTSDTLINGQLCQELTVNRYNFSLNQANSIEFNGVTGLGSQYTFSSGDTVFWWANTSFKVLYNFAAQVNESWQVENIDSNGFGCSASIVQVDSIGTTTINNQNLKFIKLKADSLASYGFTGKAIEGIGQVDDYLFPILRACDPNLVFDGPTYKLRCFSSDAFTFHKFRPEDCDYPMQVVGIKNFASAEVKIYPRPAQNFFEIETEGQGVFSLKIYNAAGTEILSKSNCTGKEKIDCHNWPAGIYTLQINGLSPQPILEKLLIK